MRKRAAIILAIIAALVLALVVAKNNSDNPLQTAEPVSQTSERVEEPVTQNELYSKILVVGDVFWGRHIELLSNQSPLGYAWPFSGIAASVSRQDYQAWIANVECPVTNHVYSYQYQIDKIVFNCRPEFLGEFAKLFDIVSLANNHSDNVNGQIGLDESRKHIEKAGLQHFGHFDPTVAGDICEVVSLPILINNETEAALPVAFCGVHGVYQAPTEENVKIIAEYAEHFTTIVMPHMGGEYVPASDELRETLYRHFIDLGADVVLGNQPHWVQNTEVYKGKLIAYSLGNLIFDQAFDVDVRRGIGIEIELSSQIDENLQKYIDLGESCFDFKDSCLSSAQTMNLQKPLIELDFGLLSFEATNYLTAKADKQTDMELRQRTNWQQTRKLLGQ